MTLITRITRLFKADLHGILDDLEEPEEVVKQAIRDMEAEMAHQEQRLGELRLTQERLRREADVLAAALQGLESQIELCFTADHEALAKTLIRKRLETTQRAQSIARAQTETLAQYDTLAQDIVGRKQQLAAVVQQLALLTATRGQQPWSASGGSPFQASSGVTDDDVEVAFLEEQQRRKPHATSNPA